MLIDICLEFYLNMFKNEAVVLSTMLMEWGSIQFFAETECLE